MPKIHKSKPSVNARPARPDIRAVAADVIDRGLYVVHLPRASKKPRGKDAKGWQKQRLTKGDVERRFQADDNLGVLNGVAAEGVSPQVVGDMDCPETIAAAPHLMPPTGLVSGHPLAPASHWHYACDDPPSCARKSFRDPTKGPNDERGVLAELLSKGSQVVWPGSIHPEGGEYYWFRHDEPGHVTASELRRAVAQTASAALLARNWPEGGRHDAALALAGGLLRAGWTIEQVEPIIRGICAASHDDEVEDRLRGVRDTAAKLADGENVTGWPTLAKLVGDEVVHAVRRWLGVRDEPSTPAASAGATPKAQARLVTRRLAEVEERAVQWLWRNWIALGMLSILDGDGGFNKTTLLINIAARLTRGLPMPHSADPPVGPADVVFISGEDVPECTLRPRARAAGADLDRVHIVDDVEQADGTIKPLQFPDDIDMIEELIIRVGANLVVIDPVMGFLNDRVNPNNDSSSRTVLTRLKQLAQRTGAAVVMVRHLNKDGDKKAMYRGGGSVAWTMSSRSAMVAGAHPDNPDVRVLAMGKCNLGPNPRSIAYTVEQVGEQAGSSIRVRWGELVDLTADDIVRAEPAAPAMRKSAEQFLRDLLAAGPRPATEVVQLARADGHSKRTLARAKKNLKVTSPWAYRENGTRYRTWALPGKKGAT
jgi:hypothetical protein